MEAIDRLRTVTAFQGVGEPQPVKIADAFAERRVRAAVSGAGEPCTEHDWLDERSVPDGARFGLPTLRAAEDSQIAGTRASHFPEFIGVFAMAKKDAARADRALGLLGADSAEAISRACDEIAAGGPHEDLVAVMIRDGASIGATQLRDPINQD